MPAEAQPTPLDALWRAFRKLVRAEIPDTVFLGTYEYNVVNVTLSKMSASKTDPSQPIPDAVTVPIRSGIPGATVVPAVGSNIHVQFLNGDPGRPVVVGYDPTDASSVQFQAAGAAPSARKGDTVNAGYLVIQTTPPGTILTPGGYFPGTPAGLIAATAAAAGLTPPGTVLGLTGGFITSGSSTVEVGS